jgi:chemotaxis protein methyltransferase CheR
MITITDKEFQQLAAFIKENYGIHLKDEKKTLVMGRLHNVLAGKGFLNFSNYYHYLVTDKSGEAISTLMNKISTNHTFFMREADHFHYFKDHVLPYLAETVRNKDLRIWSAGCSSGEEPYTLAMLIDEYFGMEKSRWDAKILATDISSRVLEEAAKGIYHNEEISTLPAGMRLSYFKRYDNDHAEIIDKIKKEVIFRRFNLMEQNFPFKRKFHVIFCRNVMIYFDNQTKRELVGKFYNYLENGGYLFIGHSESISRGETKLKYVLPAIYRKI